MERLVCFIVLAAPICSATAATPHIGYAQATGYYKKDSRPTLYQPLNLLDGREITSWCSTSSDPLADVLTFGFKDTAKIDEIRIYTGNGFDEHTFQDFSRAKRLVLKGPSDARSIIVADRRGLQAVSLKPPLIGAQFTLEILEVYPAEDPEMPVCLTDTIFYSEGKPLSGSWLTQRLKYDRAQAPLLGTWFAGALGAPDRFLSFFFDGTYRFVFQPFDETLKGRAFGGSYEASSTAARFEVPGKGKVTARVAHQGLPEAKGDRTLILEGNLPEELKDQVFRDQL
jgi:hypothetical protein